MSRQGGDFDFWLAAAFSGALSTSFRGFRVYRESGVVEDTLLMRATYTVFGGAAASSICLGNLLARFGCL